MTRITNRPLEKGFHRVESALARVNQKNTNGENGGDQEIAQFLFSRKVVSSDSSRRHWEVLCSVNCNTREDPDLDTPEPEESLS